MKKLLDLDTKVIKQLSKQALDQDYRSVKALMETILTQAANPSRKFNLGESETLYRTVLESLPHVVWIGTAKGMTIYLNSAWTKWTGRPVDESLGSEWAKSFNY